MKPDKQSAPTPDPAFSKEQFLQSKRFTALQKDVLNALLQDGETYTDEQVINIVEEFHRKVCE